MNSKKPNYLDVFTDLKAKFDGEKTVDGKEKIIADIIDYGNRFITDTAYDSNNTMTKSGYILGHYDTVLEHISRNLDNDDPKLQKQYVNVCEIRRKLGQKLRLP